MTDNAIGGIEVTVEFYTHGTDGEGMPLGIKGGHGSYGNMKIFRISEPESPFNFVSSLRNYEIGPNETAHLFLIDDGQESVPELICDGNRVRIYLPDRPHECC